MQLLKKKLKNGMTVVMEKRELPIVSVAITNKFGSEYEEGKIKGIAHFIEHLLFTGTKKRSSKDISREIDSRGGIINAFTANEITSFWVKIPSEHIDVALDVLTDMLNNSVIDREKFEKEKKVILEEIKMYHDEPRMHVEGEQIYKNLYEEPFGKSWIIGTKETINSLDRDFVYNYYKEAYNPENYIVSVVGNANFDYLCSYFEKAFKGTGKKKTHVPIKKINAESVEERAGIDQAHFVIGFHAPLAGTKEYYALQLLDAYLTVGMSSVLFTEIREKRGLAYAVKGSVESEKNYSHYTIYVGTTKEAVKDVKKIILEEMEKVKNVTEKEIQTAKEQLIGLRKVLSEESTSVLNVLTYSELVNGAEEYYQFEKKINEVTMEEVKKLAKELLKKYSTAAIVPK